MKQLRVHSHARGCLHEGAPGSNSRQSGFHCVLPVAIADHMMQASKQHLWMSHISYAGSHRSGQPGKRSRRLRGPKPSLCTTTGSKGPLTSQLCWLTVECRAACSKPPATMLGEGTTILQ